MQKVVKFLEAYIQWIAVGLGALWILLMGYSFWANDPVAAKLGKPVSPGDVDQEIQKSPAVDVLDKAWRNEGPYPQEIREYLTPRQAGSGPSASDVFNKTMVDMIAAVPERAASPFPGGAPYTIIQENVKGVEVAGATLPDLKGAVTLNSGPDGAQAVTGMSVVTRPDPAIPLQAQVLPGQQPQTTIQPPDVDLKAQVLAANAAADPNNPNPAPAPNPQANPNGQPIGPKPIVTMPEQVTWVTVSGNLDMKKLANAFQKANVPQQASFTSILRVQLIREEQQSDGTFKPSPSPNGVTPDLMNTFKPELPAVTPAPGVDQQVAATYATWAAANIADVVHPAFYDILRGDLWHTVTMPDPAAALLAQQQQQFDPAQVKPGEVNNLPPDQKAAWYKWYQDQQAQKAKNRPAPRSNSGGGSRGSSRDNGSFFEGPQVDMNRDTGAGRSRDGGAPAPARGTYVAPQPTVYTANPVAGQPATSTPLPNGTFNPAQQQTDVEIWAHDETTVPGKTYRYKLRVFFKNPMFITSQMAKNPKDADVFELVTETDWSKPVAAPNKREFYVTNGGTVIGGVPKVGVEYFKWEDGAWTENTSTLQPGDRIGDTPWTIYDLRQGSATGNESQVMLVNDNGETTTRFYKTDRDRPERKRLMALIRAATPPPGTTPQPGLTNPAGGRAPGADGTIPPTRG